MSQGLLRNCTTKAADAIQMSVMEVANLRKSVVPAEAVLMALIEQKDSIAIKIFDELKEDTGEIRRRIVDAVGQVIQELPEFAPQQVANIKISGDVQHLFEAAERERRRFGDSYISTAALFLGCFAEEVQPTRKILFDVNISYDSVSAAYEAIRGKLKISHKDDESKQSFLEQYATDLTALARRGELDPVIGRDDEISQVVQILSRRKKNNPVLIGEPGVGKTVIVEGLAQQIAKAEVPEYLLNKRIMSLEIGNLIAGAKMQGEFEERLRNVISEVTHSGGNIILFVDELHTVVGAGRTGGSLDASNMLKPALARGLLQCIGATTNKEFKQYIESDKALARRFQPVRVNPPSVEHTIKILEGLKKNTRRTIKFNILKKP